MRASKRPIQYLCASSAAPAKYEIEAAKEAADTGSISHRAHGAQISGDEYDHTAACNRAGIDPNEVELLLESGRRACMDLGIVDSTEPLTVNRTVYCEQSMDDPETGDTGTPDLAFVDDHIFTIVDWKTGYVDRDHYHQLAQYARNGLLWMRREHPEIEVSLCRTIVKNIRTQHRVSHLWSMDELEDWREDMVSREAQIGKVYNPDEHCALCPHRFDCEARQKVLQGACAALSAESFGEEMTAERIGELYKTYRMVKSAMGNYDKALNILLAEGGSVPIGDGKALQKVESQQDKLVPNLAWSVLKAHGMTESQLSGLVSMAKGAVLKEATQGAPRGYKGKHQTRLLDELRKAGAVEKKTVSKRTEVSVHE